MKVRLQCEICGTVSRYDLTEFFVESYEASVKCHGCSSPINIQTETITLEEKLKEQLPVLEEGETVRLDNREHVWHNEIALICERKHKFYRIELHGKKIWVPEDWVVKTS